MKIAILTSGGDSAGMNAVVRAAVKAGILKCVCQRILSGISLSIQGLRNLGSARGIRRPCSRKHWRSPATNHRCTAGRRRRRHQSHRQPPFRRRRSAQKWIGRLCKSQREVAQRPLHCARRLGRCPSLDRRGALWFLNPCTQCNSVSRAAL